MSAARTVLVVAAVLVALVVIALVGGVVYVNRFSPAAPYLKGIKTVAIVRSLERGIANRAEYGAPASGQVSDEQAGRFVKVEEQVDSAVGGRMALLNSTSEALHEREKAERGLTVQAALKEVGAIESVLLDAKREQIAALNAVGLSKSEYEWVRHQLYAAAGVDLAQLDLEGLASFNTAEDLVDIWRPRSAPSAPANRQRAERHTEHLRRWRPLAFFGL